LILLGGRRGGKGKVVFALECSCPNHAGQDERIFRIKDNNITAILKILTIPIQTIAKTIIC